jgi:hypothetical protein
MLFEFTLNFNSNVLKLNLFSYHSPPNISLTIDDLRIFNCAVAPLGRANQSPRCHVVERLRSVVMMPPEFSDS